MKNRIKNERYFRIKRFYRLNRLDRAVTECFAVLRFVHEDKRALFYLADIYNRMNDFDKSSAVYEKLLEIYPDDTRIKCNYAGVLIKYGNLFSAKEQLEQALRIDRKDFFCRYNLNKLNIKLKKKNKRGEVFSKKIAEIINMIF